MKIVFLCPSLELGRDGVGDYSIRLASELERQGHECLCIAFNDRKTVPGEQTILDSPAASESITNNATARLSLRHSVVHRIDVVRRELHLFQADWVSLQYVPWAFGNRGLHFGLPSALGLILGRAKLHVMCHELWLQGRLFSWRQRLLGTTQKMCIRHMFAALQPPVVHTHLSYYRDLLSGIRVKSELLPLHGNITLSSTKTEGRAWLKSFAGVGDAAFCLGFFGEIHSSINIEALRNLVSEFRRKSSNVSVMTAGQLTANGEATWSRIASALAGVANCVVLGRLSEADVSKYLSGLDVGLTSYPSEFAGKSGGVAAMLEHGLQVELLGSPTGVGNPERLYRLLPEQACSASNTAERMAKSLGAETAFSNN